MTAAPESPAISSPVCSLLSSATAYTARSSASGAGALPEVMGAQAAVDLTGWQAFHRGRAG